jgi:hypothetical protein
MALMEVWKHRSGKSELQITSKSTYFRKDSFHPEEDCTSGAPWWSLIPSNSSREASSSAMFLPLLLAPVAALLAALASAFKPLGGGGVIFVLVGSVARPRGYYD